jgi:murein DD-endopeptidase MepM/ murein hydrolase activator NlpD
MAPGYRAAAMPAARPRAAGRRALALVAIAALGAPAAGAAQGPAEDSALALDAAETRVRALEQVVAGEATRLGIRPPDRAEPETLEGLAVRAAELEEVAAFLAGRRELVRPRPKPGAARPAPVRPLRRGGHEKVAALAERLGLDRPPPPAPPATAEERAAESRRLAAIAAWLSGSAEAPRDAELPLLWPARGWDGIRWGREGGGVDIAIRAGAPVLAAAAGTVAQAGEGGVVVVRHDGGLATVYADLDAVGVTPGQAVARGQAVGRIGASAGAHLHFEVRVGGVAVDAREHVRPPRRRPAAPPTKTALRAEPPDRGAPAPDCPAPGGLPRFVVTPAGFTCEPAAGKHYST